jgi:hypothetical protein
VTNEPWGWKIVWIETRSHDKDSGGAVVKAKILRAILDIERTGEFFLAEIGSLTKVLCSAKICFRGGPIHAGGEKGVTHITLSVNQKDAKALKWGNYIRLTSVKSAAYPYDYEYASSFALGLRKFRESLLGH